MNTKIALTCFGVLTVSSASLKALIKENARYKRRNNSKKLL